MIDALFGSKTRVKLLHLFLNHPGDSFYVREITRLVDEQINSVRRELANMLNVGIISSDSADNKLFYQVNQRYQHYVAFRAIFADAHIEPIDGREAIAASLIDELATLPGVRIAIAAGVLVPHATSNVDLLLIGHEQPARVSKFIKEAERLEGRELNYTVLSYDEFYYRLSLRDKFITEIMNGPHSVLLDSDNMLK